MWKGNENSPGLQTRSAQSEQNTERKTLRDGELAPTIRPEPPKRRQVLSSSRHVKMLRPTGMPLERLSRALLRDLGMGVCRGERNDSSVLLIKLRLWLGRKTGNLNLEIPS